MAKIGKCVPYTTGKDPSKFSAGWNHFLHGFSRSSLAHQWMRDGWDAAKKYAARLDIPIPCPMGYERTFAA